MVYYNNLLWSEICGRWWPPSAHWVLLKLVPLHLLLMMVGLGLLQLLLCRWWSGYRKLMLRVNPARIWGSTLQRNNRRRSDLAFLALEQYGVMKLTLAR